MKIQKIANKSPISKAAIKYEDKIWIGKRHGEIIQQMVVDGFDKRITQAMQGFITEDGQFLSRKDAYYRAIECGQIKDDNKTPLLLSEMLY